MTVGTGIKPSELQEVEIEAKKRGIKLPKDYFWSNPNEKMIMIVEVVGEKDAVIAFHHWFLERAEQGVFILK